MGTIIGIDLGTTNSCVAVIEGTRPNVIHNKEGSHITPSMVAIGSNNDWLVGTLAKRQAVANPKNTVFSVKRLIGKRFDSEAIRQLKQHSPYDIVSAPNGDAWVKIGEKNKSPQEISARVLKHMKEIAEDYLGHTVDDAVITVPAYFNDQQRQATKDAGKIAKLNVRRIVNEPTAAALAYGIQKEQDQTLAVFDLGGGTFDISIMEVTGNAFEVLATAGDTMLGGDDFDKRIVDFLVEHIEREYGTNIQKDATALRRLKEVAEEAKKELSHAASTSISVPFLTQHQGNPIHLELESLSRELMESLIQDELERLKEPCEQALLDAGLSFDHVDRVLLVGGMTRMPAVQRMVSEIFQQKPKKDVNPDQVVAMGAALQASILAGDRTDAVLMDVTPHSLGIRVVDGKFSKVIGRNTRIPCRERKTFAPAEKDQDFVTLEVYQGEASYVKDNRYLGEFRLSGIPKLEGKREAHIQVTFHIDADGIVHVSAIEPTSGVEASVSIQASGGLTNSQLDELVEGV